MPNEKPAAGGASPGSFSPPALAAMVRAFTARLPSRLAELQRASSRIREPGDVEKPLSLALGLQDAATLYGFEQLAQKAEKLAAFLVLGRDEATRAADEWIARVETTLAELGLEVWEISFEPRFSEE